MRLVSADVGVTDQSPDDAWVGYKCLRRDGRHAPRSHNVDHLDDLICGVSGRGCQRENVGIFHKRFGRQVFCHIPQRLRLSARASWFVHVLRFVNDEDATLGFEPIDSVGFSRACKHPER